MGTDARAARADHGDGCTDAGTPATPTDLFEVRKVADGVYVAVAAPAYKVNSNAAIIDTGDGLMVVDTHSKPSAARALVRMLRDLLPTPVRYVVNTHFHWDHWQGNEVYPAAYPGVEVITTSVTREAMVRKSLKRIQDHLRAGPAELAGLRVELEAATDPARRRELEGSLRQAETYLVELGRLRPTLPTMAFDQTMRVFKRDREIQLLHLGRAHTAGDLFVYLPRERAVATGDAVIGWAPFMGDGYPEEWGETLGRLAQLDVQHLLMGHGEPADRAWLGLFRGYVEDLVEAVRRHAAAGATLEVVKERVPDELAPRYEQAFSRYGDYRPWRQLVLGNIERAYAHVS
jgi:glyoxylase-like metal-dependent hydrolase (beta-lactamase superfamily II)